MAERNVLNRWWVVFTTITAFIAGQGAIMFSGGVFLKPVGQDLHFGRGTFSTGMGTATIFSAFGALILGWLMDRYGMRVVMLPAIVVFALFTGALSLMTSSVTLLLVLFALQGFVSSSQGPTGFTKMISARFDDKRGLALGIALAGGGLGMILLPQYARLLLAHFGWRGGYMGLCVAVLILSVIPVSIFFREPEEMKKDREMRKVRGRVDNPALPGITMSEALRTPKYWVLLFSIFLMLTAVDGVMVHMVPLLTDRGISVKMAVGAMGVGGFTLIVGRVIAGYLLDKIWAVYIAIFFLLMPMLGIGILISGAAGAWPGVAVVTIGLSIGAEFDLMAFFLGRYFGIRAFGTLMGGIQFFIGFANASGMMLMGWCFQLEHSYIPMLYVFEGTLLASMVLICCMGQYRYPAVKKQRAEKLVTAS